MKAIRSALMGIIVVAVLLAAQAFTSNVPEASALPSIQLGMPIAAEENSEVDQLREICKVEWPRSVAGADAELARTKACRNFAD